MENQSFIKELLARRVPQIVGLYIAATWMMIEIGDWIVERFFLAPEITSYIFIGMLTFIPSIVYLAYQYGKPGPDKWKMATFTVIPLNLFIAVAAMHYVVEPIEATTTKVVVDEKGVEQSFEVPKEEYRQEVVNFFWKNKSNDQSINWMQYGLPWLLSKDLERSLFISSYSPFSSDKMLGKIRKAGFENGLRVPKALQISLAKDKFAQYIINGEFDVKDGLFELKVELIELKSGKKMVDHSVKGNDLLQLIDDLTISIKDSLNIPKNIEELSTDLPTSEHISESIPAIKEFIQAKLKRQIEDNYIEAKQHLKSAIEKDFSFAYAYIELALVDELMANAEEAQIAIKSALKHEYKLSVQDKFKYRAMAYSLSGDYVSQVKVYDMWLELNPNDIDAHESMVEILLLTGLDHKKAIASVKRLRELNPSDNAILKSMAKLFLLNGELDKAETSLENYISIVPEDTAALIQLADIYGRATRFEEARRTLERVTLLDRDNTTAALKVVLLDIKLGNYVAAENYLDSLLQRASTSEQKFNIYAGYANFYLVRGEINKLIESMNNMSKNSQHLPPIAQLFNIEFQKSMFLGWLGKTNEALALLENVRSQIQPPLDGVIDLGLVGVYQISKAEDAGQQMKASLDNLDIWIKDFPNPIFASVLDTSKAEYEILQGNYKSAISLYKNSLAQMSNTVVNLRNEDSINRMKVRLAHALFLDGDHKSAEKELVEVIERSPVFALAHIILAKIYQARDDTEKFNHSIEIIAKAWENADEDYYEYQEFMALKESFKKS